MAQEAYSMSRPLTKTTGPRTEPLHWISAYPQTKKGDPRAALNSRYNFIY